MAYLSMTPEINYKILDYDLVSVYYEYKSNTKYQVYKGVGKIYNRFKNMIIKERGRVCEQCQNEGDIIHHIKPAITHPDLYYSIKNIIVLCPKCHTECHKKGWLNQDAI